MDLSWRVVDSRRTIQEVLNKSYIRLSTKGYILLSFIQASYAFYFIHHLRLSSKISIYAFLVKRSNTLLNPIYAFLGKRSKTLLRLSYQVILATPFFQGSPPTPFLLFPFHPFHVLRQYVYMGVKYNISTTPVCCHSPIGPCTEKIHFLSYK